MTEMMIAAALGYFAGSVPFGLVCAYLAGLGDIRKIGSGNIGATNVLRTGHKLAAFGTLIGDAGKGGAVVGMMLALGWTDQAPLAGLAAVVGHCYPIWLRFKGGKGVATAIATLAVLYWPAGLTMAVTWLIMSALFRISSLSALTGFATATLISALSFDGWPYICAIAALSYWRHRENIARIFAGTESKISFKKSV